MAKFSDFFFYSGMYCAKSCNSQSRGLHSESSVLVDMDSLLLILLIVELLIPYRPHKSDFPFTSDKYKKFTAKLYDEILKAIKNEFSRFMVRCAPRMDIISAELDIVAKEQNPDKDIKLICALP